MKNIKALLVLMGMEIGGAETHVLELAIGLKNQGVDVIVASNGGVYAQELEKNGIKHFAVPLHNKKPKNMIKSFFRLIKIIKTEKPNVVHGHARIPSFILGIINKFIKFNFVTTAHWVFDASGLLKYLSSWGYRTIAVSEDIKKYLIDNYGILSQDITVTINGISMDKFSPNIYCEEILHEFGMSKEKRKIVYISRMDADRSLVAHHLIEIAPKLREKEDIEIVIVGGGNDFDNVDKEAQRSNRIAGQKYIYTTGARTDIYKFVSIADFMVAVSRSALEAMSAAVPVIVAGNEGYLGIFDESNLSDAIATNFCCRGMAQPSVELLEKDLYEMLDYSNDKLKELGEYGRELIRSNYSVKKMVEDNISVYEDIIKHGNVYKDIVVSGYYGFKNSGDDALLAAIINEIRSNMPKARFVVLSANPKETEKNYGVSSINRYNFFKINKALSNSSMLINGGGSLIQDATSTHSLVYYVKIMKMAMKKGVKVIVYANGIGPVYKAVNKKRAKSVLSKVDFITLRDEKSLVQLDKLGVENKNVLVTADPSINIGSSEPEIAEELLKKEGIPEGEYVAISLREWENIDMTDSISKIADYFYERYNLIPLFIPMQMPNDLEICKKCAASMKNKGYVISNHYHFRHIMAVVAKCKIVMGMRLHMLMYAANMAIPVIGLVYDPKIEGYLNYLEQDSTVDITNINLDEIIKLVDKIMLDHDEISAQLKRRIDVLRQKSEKNSQIVKKYLNK